MRLLIDDTGMGWRATAIEEETTRHHGRWYLVFHPEGDMGRLLPIPEVRWQNRATAERTITTMSEKELRRRLAIARNREPRAMHDAADAA